MATKYKSAIIVIIAFVMQFLFTPPAQAITGDLNNDGTVDADDINIIINVILNKDAATAQIIADINNDGVTDGIDLNAIMNIVLGKYQWVEPVINQRTFTVKGISFTMLEVEGGEVDLGKRSVKTVNNFWMMETEMTEALASTLYGRNATQSSNYYYNWVKNTISRNNSYLDGMYPPNSNPPHHSYSDEAPAIMERANYDIQPFLNQLYEYTGHHFRLPTLAEWTFAARGGNYSRGYTYSGSNNASEVGIFNAYTPQSVKQKNPNEIGFYDMSGNVGELVTIDPSPYPCDNCQRLVCGGDAFHVTSPEPYNIIQFATNEDENCFIGLRLVLAD